MKHRYLFVYISFALLYACHPQIDPSAVAIRPLNTKRFVAIGDVYTSGAANRGWFPYADEGLTAQQQQLSYPALLASYFQKGLPSNFGQPQATGLGGGVQRLKKHATRDCAGAPVFPEWDWLPGTNGLLEFDISGPIDNLGIPGMRLSDWMSSEMPFASSPSLYHLLIAPHQHLRGLVGAQKGDFFSIWLGTEDILLHAASGSAFPSRRPESPAILAERIDSLLGMIASNNPGARMLVANLPEITNFPYFTTVPHWFPQSQECQVTYQKLFIQTQAGARLAGEGDLILLPATAVIGLPASNGERVGLSQLAPLPDSLVLDREEVAEVRAWVTAFNLSLAQVIAARRGRVNVDLVNIQQAFQQLAEGPHTQDGVVLSTEYLLGDVFSLDGLTLTPRGTAWVVNTFIQAINNFGPLQARLSTLNLADYPGTIFP